MPELQMHRVPPTSLVTTSTHLQRANSFVSLTAMLESSLHLFASSKRHRVHKFGLCNTQKFKKKTPKKYGHAI